MEFIPTIRGARKLCYAGHAYTFKAKSNSSQRWECSQRRGKKCRAILSTDINLTEVKSVTEHNHEADHFTIQAMKVKAEIKACVTESRGTTGQVVIDKLAQYPKEVTVAAGNMDSLKRNARRNKHGSTPTEPSSISDIPVPLPSDYTKNLIYDNESAQNRMLVYATEDGLRLLGEANTWFMDGTHSTAPSQFQQVFCIRAALGDSYQSVAYALLPGKTQQMYEECFTAILDACLQRDVRPNPIRVVADYEMAIHNAVKTAVCSNIDIQGCFYHLTQSTWRRVQTDGLRTQYRDDEEFRHFCGMLDGLAFLPVDDVKEGMRVLREVASDNSISLVDYFDTTYVNGGFRTVLSQNGTMKFRRTAPRFEPETWNVHNATMTGAARTNNVCEGWNNGFSKLVGHANPSIWTVIKCLNKDAAMVEADILRHQRCQQVSKRRRRAVVTHQKTLETLCAQYVNKDKSLAQFLYAIGDNIRINS